MSAQDMIKKIEEKNTTLKRKENVRQGGQDPWDDRSRGIGEDRRSEGKKNGDLTPKD